MHHYFKYLILSFFISALVACGGGSGSSGETPVATDTDLDGIADNIDTDDDNDGVLDIDDAFPLDASESIDTDGDLIGNNADTDDDGDGVLDIDDVFALDSTESRDTDGDGVGDNADPDADNDALSDEDEIAAGSDITLADSDDDGFSDREEVKVYGTNPSDPASLPSWTRVTGFENGDLTDVFEVYDDEIVENDNADVVETQLLSGNRALRHIASTNPDGASEGRNFAGYLQLESYLDLLRENPNFKLEMDILVDYDVPPANNTFAGFQIGFVDTDGALGSFGIRGGDYYILSNISIKELAGPDIYTFTIDGNAPSWGHGNDVTLSKIANLDNLTSMRLALLTYSDSATTGNFYIDEIRILPSQFNGSPYLGSSFYTSLNVGEPNTQEGNARIISNNRFISEGNTALAVELEPLNNFGGQTFASIDATAMLKAGLGAALTTVRQGEPILISFDVALDGDFGSSGDLELVAWDGTLEEFYVFDRVSFMEAENKIVTLMVDINKLDQIAGERTWIDYATGLLTVQDGPSPVFRLNYFNSANTTGTLIVDNIRFDPDVQLGNMNAE